MKTFIITITHHPEAMELAHRCYDSCLKYGIRPEIVPAFTPKDNPLNLINTIIGRNVENLFEEQPRPDAVAACFASHLMLWSRCALQEDEFFILEHDSIMVRPLPNIEYKGVVTHGNPTWGREAFKIDEDTNIGVNDVPWGGFLGNHGYQMKPSAAQEIMKYLRSDECMPLECADWFLNTNKFPFIQYCKPYCVEVEETFTFIQSGDTIKIKDNVTDWENYRELDADEHFYNHVKS